MNDPIGFDGLTNAGSSAATSVWVTTVTARLSIPSRSKSLCRFCCSAYPIAPWVSAPHASSGTSCSSCAASSDRRRMNPTCGPLPWVIATSHPSLIIDAMCQHVSPAAMYWSRTLWWSDP